jgi:N-acetylmuramoyl-L-alanine amidase
MAQVSQHTATLPHRQTATQKRMPTRGFGQPLIVIDPGHGGRDPGAIGASGTLEKTIMLATALELRRVLEATGRYRIALTRTTDRTVSLSDRVAFARKYEADLLIAIHADASRNHHARGASVYVRSGHQTIHLTASSGNAARVANALSAPEPQQEPSSAWLLYTMIEQLADNVRMVVAPARAAHLYVLGSQAIPSVLLEMGFLSNRQDEALLSRAAHRRVIVQAIKDAIDDYFASIKATTSHG